MFEWIGSLVKLALESVSQANAAALIALFLVAAFTEIGVPFPFVIDSVLLYAGYESDILSPAVFLILMALLVGREVGAAAIFWPTKLLGKGFLGWLAKRFPKLCNRLRELASRLGHRAPAAVAVARLTPGLLTPSTVASAIIDMRYWHFILGIVLASAAADGALLAAGLITKYGLSHLGISPPPWLIVLVFAGIICLVWGVQSLISRRRRPMPSPETKCDVETLLTSNPNPRRTNTK